MSDGILLSGDVFIDLLTDAGVSTGLIGPINTTKLAIKANSESKDRNSTKKLSFGQALDSIPIPAPTEVTFEFDDQPADMLAALLMGDQSALTAAAGTLTDTAFTLPTNQRWVELGKINFTDVGFVVKQGATTLALNTDYLVDYSAGLVRAVKGGAVENGGAITVTASHQAVTGTQVTGGTKSQIKARLKLSGKNLANGKTVTLDIPQTVLKSDSEIDFMNSEFVTGSLSGKLILATGQTEPYIYQEF